MPINTTTEDEYAGEKETRRAEIRTAEMFGYEARKRLHRNTRQSDGSSIEVPYRERRFNNIGEWDEN
jgi:hypothetical protein